MRLRPFEIGDSIAVQRLAGDRKVALAAAAIPHPYPDGEAERWIATHAPAFVARHEITFAVVLADEDALVGAIALIEWNERHARGELGYWIGVDYWNRGYCTEAAAELIRYAHESHRVTKIVARCALENRASSRVMEKLGLEREGLLAKHAWKHGQYDDVLVYGLILPGRDP